MYYLGFPWISNCLPFAYMGNATEDFALPRRLFKVGGLSVCRFLTMAGL